LKNQTDAFDERLTSIPDLRGSLLKLFPTKGGVPEVVWDISQTQEIFFTRSKAGVFRGLLAQRGEHSSDKVVLLIQGKITDFLIDLRSERKDLGSMQVRKMDGSVPIAIFVLDYYAHGYYVHEEATVMYLYSNVHCQDCEVVKGNNRVIPKLGIPIDTWIVSKKDRDAFSESI